MTNPLNKAPVWFWMLSVLALLWNLIGIIAYLTMAFATDEMIVMVIILCILLVFHSKNAITKQWI